MSNLIDISLPVADDLDPYEVYQWVNEHCAPGYLVTAGKSWNGNSWIPYVHVVIPADKHMLFKLTWGGR